jgi:predicted RNA-binding Zn-ribbon protein involved in translation (DUF1610 family)
MTTDLVYRLRTCAAAILAVDPRESWVALVSDDAASLLIEASNVIDAARSPEPLGEPMAKLEPAKPPPATGPTWVAIDLPSVAPRPCPACGDVSARRVDRRGRQLLLTCPGCSHQWEYAA